MDRRAFIENVVLGVLAAREGARAQPSSRVYRIGILGHGLSSDFSGPRPLNPAVNALIVGLREFYVVVNLPLVQRKQSCHLLEKILQCHFEVVDK